MDRDLPLVSIMISYFNQSHCFEKCLQSAIEQNYENIEIVIGDDASTENDILLILSRYQEDNIRYFRNQKNLGPSGNYRQLLEKHAQGEFVLLLNADDYFIDADYISEAVSVFKKNKNVSMVFGEVKKYLEKTDEFISDDCNQSLSPLMDGNTFFLNYWKGYSLPHCTCVYDRKHALSLGFYQDNSISTDLDSLLRTCIDKKVGYINQEVAVMVKHASNFTKSVDHYFSNEATNFIHNPYAYAKENSSMDHALLEQWKDKMSYRYHFKILTKLLFIAPEKIQSYKELIRKKSPKTFRALSRDARWQGLRLAKKSHLLMRLVFKYVLKQESFIADLIVNKRNQ